MVIHYPISAPHASGRKALAAALNSHLQNGLTEGEAKKRSAQFGLNVYQQAHPEKLLTLLLRQFKSAVVYLLLFGAIVSFYFKDIPEAIAILVVIVVNALIGFLMEWQARTSMNELQRMEIVKAKTIRDGFLIEVDSVKLVPGDLIYVEAGDMIPADGRLVDLQQLQCDESALTGESQPVRKNTENLVPGTVLAERLNMIFKGTAVVSGNGKALVTAIAKHTELGQIATLVEAASANTGTSFDQKLNALTRKLIYGTLLITGLFIILQIVQGKSLFLILETAVALSVASVPEGLPVVATIALSRGMLIMARRNAIVKRLTAVETLGSTDVILTDKTGTLTENKIEISALTFPDEKFIISDHMPMPVPEKSSVNFEKLLLSAVLCNNAPGHPHNASDPLEASLLQLAGSAGMNIGKIRERYPRITEIPFNSETMMMITLHKAPNGYLTAAKGAAEQLLTTCDRLQSGHKVRKLTPADQEHLLRQADDMAEEGLRVLAFAWKEDMPDHDHFSEGLIFAGLAGFLDPPRKDIKSAIEHCRKAGIRVVMITGDHPRTALHIARAVGLTDHAETAVINGKNLPALGVMDAGWKKKILGASVFARATPQQKLDIATVYQEAGHIIAMTGDGINDAPALKKADIGIAMGLRGTQVARETADIVLRDDSFVSITEAVAQGRAIFQNVRKFVVYLISCNLSEVMTVALLGVFIPGAVLLPLQILFLNLVTDVFPALALGLGPAAPNIMLQPADDQKSGILDGSKLLKIMGYATVITLVIITAVAYCRQLGYGSMALNNVAFFTLTFAQLVHVFNMAEQRSAFLVNEISRNSYVWGAVVLCVLLLAGAYQIPQLAAILNLNSLPLQCWLIIVGAGLMPLVLIQLTKLIRLKVQH